MTNNRDFAERTLGHYFRLVARSAGVQWDSDNDAEVANIVDALLQEARYEALEAVRQELSEDGIALVYSMAQNKETVKTAVAEALHREQEAERMDCPPAIMLEHAAQRLDARAAQQTQRAPLVEPTYEKKQAQTDTQDGVHVATSMLDADTAHVEVCTTDGKPIVTATVSTGTGYVRLYHAQGYVVEVLRGEDYWQTQQTQPVDATQTDGAGPTVSCPFCGYTGAPVHHKTRPYYLQCSHCQMLWQKHIGDDAVCPVCHGVSYLIHTDNAGPDVAQCLDCGHDAYWHEFHKEWHAVTHFALSSCGVCRATQEG